MAVICVNDMYMGETAEVVSISGDIPEIKRLRNMGIREGKLIDLLHHDPMATKKVVIGVDSARIAFDVKLAYNIKVRPLKSYYETVKTQAQYDSLTGCYNRYEANRILECEYEKFVTKGTPLSLLIADIDFFKKINDNYGHNAGDEVLRAFAGILRQNMKRSDILCRWGGEEFLVMLRGTPVNNIVQIAERLRQSIEAYVFPPFKDSGCVTVSIGGCGLPPYRPIQPLIETADKSLYMAKDNGRNQVKICAE